MPFLCLQHRIYDDLLDYYVRSLSYYCITVQMLSFFGGFTGTETLFGGNMKHKSLLKTILSLLLVCLLASVLCGSVMAIAAGGDGSGGDGGTTNETTTGTGSGDDTSGSSDKPIALVSSTPTANAADVAVDTPIKLEFSENIAYASVRDANIQAITLWAGDQPVKAEITMADDQLEPDLKNVITIIPGETLLEDTVYTIKVDKTLSSKSGNILAEPMELTFTTSRTVQTTNEITSSSSDINTTWIVLGIMLTGIILIAVILLKRKNV